MGRPPKVNKSVMQEIAELLAQGETVVSITKRDSFPSYQSVMRAVIRDEELAEIYDTGLRMQAEYYKAHISELSRAPLEMEDNRLANAEVQRRKLEIDSLKWILSRNQPRGLRNREEDKVQDAAIVINWGSGESA